ncbi:alanine:cation symporter family protein [Acinetobacter soli]
MPSCTLYTWAGIKHEKGQVSSFQAFAIGTAARVGTGNIAGV